jgi:hypothetical protein
MRIIRTIGLWFVRRGVMKRSDRCIRFGFWLIGLMLLALCGCSSRESVVLALGPGECGRVQIASGDATLTRVLETGDRFEFGLQCVRAYPGQLVILERAAGGGDVDIAVVTGEHSAATGCEVEVCP